VVTTEEVHLAELSSEECFSLLRSRNVGRVAVTIPGDGPLVVPVNYVVDGEAVMFRTAGGTKIDALRVGPVSFQLDHIDPVSRTGWSVLVRGPAYEASHWETDHLHLEPWVPGRKDRWVRVLARSVSGRRITLPPFVPNAAAYL
jgi:nitroimidazol reductase NimA-like FMN-containing flavoprotein (pyridoxamine 5'-phosphate oxidase superfamily)